jgi:hypothetical protein
LWTAEQNLRIAEREHSRTRAAAGARA